MAGAASSSPVERTYLVISAVYTLSASLIWGVNTLFLLDAGLDIFEAFVANAAFTAGMVLFEIPTGVVADTRGRRASFLLGCVTLAAGTVAYLAIWAAGGGLAPFIVSSVGLGLGFSFFSGAIEAWVVDALHAEGYGGTLDKVFARGSMVTGVAMTVGTIGGGLLGDLSLGLPYVGRALLLLAAFAYGWRAMHDLGFTPRATSLSQMPEEMNHVLRASITYGWRARSVRLLMLMSLVQGGYLMWGFYAWQPYFLELLGRDAVWVGGFVAAGIALATIAGNSLVERLSGRGRRRTRLMAWSLAVYAAATLALGFAPSFGVAFGALLVASAATGVSGPVKQAYLHGLIPSEERATVVSFDSLVGSAGGVVGQAGLGYVSRVASIATGYTIGGVSLFLSMPLLFLLRARGDDADLIHSQAEAGTDSACAGQGLPEVAHVDARSRGRAPGEAEGSPGAA